jgi:hypothetical protein
MKAIFALLFSGVLSAACVTTAADGTTPIAADGACACGTTDPCAATKVCLIGAVGAACVADVAAITALAKCTNTDGTANTAICFCDAAKPAAAALATGHICAADDTCDVSLAAAKRCATPAADDSADASMIAAFATIMTTAMFSF